MAETIRMWFAWVKQIRNVDKQDEFDPLVKPVDGLDEEYLRKRVPKQEIEHTLTYADV